MASEFLMFGLTNAVIAAGLAALIALGLKWRHNAHLAALFWTLILVKLVSPPVVPFSIVRPWDSRPVADTVIGNEDEPRVDHDSSDFAVTPNHASPDSAGALSAVSTAERARPGDAVAAGTIARATTDVISPRDRATVSMGATLWSPGYVAAVWLGGSLVALAWLIVSGLRVRRLIRSSQLATDDPALADVLAQLGRRWKLRRPPRLRIVDARISPLLWTWFDGATLVIPRALLGLLSPLQQEMILAHELAHFRRGDHLFRWLEVVVQSLYWWLPMVPWVRRQLHREQEDCCDMLVRQQFPDRDVEYCDTLLTTSIWLQEVRRSPLFASELGNANGLKRRMQMMLERKTTSPVPRRLVAACIMLGLAVCITSVRWVNAQPASDKPDAVLTEFIVSNEQYASIASGTLQLRGYYDNGDFFEQDLLVETGRATFEFQRPRLRELRVSISAAGYLSHTRELEVDGTERGFAVGRQYTFVLKPGFTIGGKIVDEAGRPLPGVHVFLNSPSTTREDGSRDYAEGWFQTDADGKWTCPGVPSEMQQLGLRLEHATHVSEGSETLAPFEHQPVKPEEFPGLRAQTDVRIMREDPPLVGKVVDADGNPVPHVVVDISGRQPDWHQHYARGMVIRSNESGEFRVPRPPHGEQQLTLNDPNGIRQVVDITVPPPEPLTITLKNGRRIEFRVVDTTGLPIPDVTFLPEVAGAEFRGKTDAEGRWVWENAPNDKVRFQVLSEDYLCQPQDANYGPDDSPVTLTLRRNLPVIGKVVDAETGAPIREFRLYKGTHFKVNRSDLWDWSMQTSQILRPVKGSWAEGLASGKPRTQLEPGEFQHRLYTLDRLIRYRIQADGYLPAMSEPLDAAALPDKPVELEFRLKKYDGIVATVRTPAGEPAAGAQVATLVKRGNDDHVALNVHNGAPSESSGPQPTVAVRADTAGRFELAIHNDPFVCLVTHQTGYLELKDRELTERVELTLRPWTTVEGTVRVQGAPTPGAQVSLYLLRTDDTGGEGDEVPIVRYGQTATTDADGHYRALHGFQGAWTVRVSYPPPAGGETDGAQGERPSQTSSFNINLTDAETTTLDIGSDGVDVVGRVILPEGSAAEGSFIGVEFRRERVPDSTDRGPRESYQATLSADGTFRCFNLRPGDYKGYVIEFRRIAVAAFEGRPVTHFWNAEHKRGFEAKLQLTADMLADKLTTDPVDLGDVRLEPN